MVQNWRRLNKLYRQAVEVPTPWHSCNLNEPVASPVLLSIRSGMARVGKGFQVGLSWTPDRDGHVPYNAIDAGGGVFVARMRHSGDLIPGKVVPQYGKAYCSHGGCEHEYFEYEVLCNTSAPNTRPCYKWEHSSDGHVPKKSIVAGLAEDQSPLYVARVQIEGEWVVGKVHQGHSCGYFPYGGEEHSKESYEVLVLDK
ncbi:unnamed protein product [Dicrocoelium dendriticum]|nr:unnamed protein product [Dicrocoelium dendriticum]